jgi:rhodanese-related sulfurtransferase
MTEEQPPTAGQGLHDDGTPISGLQGLEHTGAKIGSNIDLSYLNTAPDPFMEPGLAIHRRRPQRVGRFQPANSAAVEKAGLPGLSNHPLISAPVSCASTSEPSSDAAQRITSLLASLEADPKMLRDAAQFVLDAVASLHADPKPLSNLIQSIMGLLTSIQGTGGAPGIPAAELQGAPGSDVYQAILNEPNPKTGQVSTEEMVQILAQQSATVFDGRTRLEYAIGHLPGALSLAPKPGTPKSKHVGDVDEVARIVPNRTAPIIVYCNGPFCGKSRRLGEELVNAGFTNVRRYQLGTPVWRALVGPMEIELEGIRYIRKGDQTSVFLDARSPEEFASGSLPGAQHVPVGDIAAAKSDGRLPMDDFNTRVVTFGRNGEQARALADALAHTGFNNVKFYDGTFASLLMGL